LTTVSDLFRCFVILVILVLILMDNNFTKVDFHNFDLAKAPGRTYKYYTGQPLFRFGEGMSYSTFELKCAVSGGSLAGAGAGAGATTITCKVIHVLPSPPGDEVLMVYHAVSDNIRAAAKHPVPLRALVG
jgi:hypothetical protein